MKDNKSDYTVDNRINQRDWDNVALGWKKWWSTFEKGGQKVSDKLVELASVREGQKILDIATGIGEPALTAARKVGNSGNVLATDISSDMLAIGIERARLEGLSNIEFKEGDAATISLPHLYFDAALSRWGLMFLPDLSDALINIRKSLVPGGKFAAAVWAEADKVPQLNIAMAAVRQHLKMPPLSSDAEGPFCLADYSKLKKIFLSAGFSDFKSEKIVVTFEFDLAENYVEFTQDIAAPVNLMLYNVTAKKRDEIWRKIIHNVKSRYTSNGRVLLHNECMCIVACN